MRNWWKSVRWPIRICERWAISCLNGQGKHNSNCFINCLFCVRCCFIIHPIFISYRTDRKIPFSSSRRQTILGDGTPAQRTGKTPGESGWKGRLDWWEGSLLSAEASSDRGYFWLLRGYCWRLRVSGWVWWSGWCVGSCLQCVSLYNEATWCHGATLINHGFQSLTGCHVTTPYKPHIVITEYHVAGSHKPCISIQCGRLVCWEVKWLRMASHLHVLMPWGPVGWHFCISIINKSEAGMFIWENM